MSIKEREQLASGLFPGGIPYLWCPPLTHYTPEGALDKKRIRAHLKALAPYVKTFLIPGSTGDGWELSRAEIESLLTFILTENKDIGPRVLIGALQPKAEDALRDIKGWLELLQSLAGAKTSREALEKTGVCGFTVCPPKGKGLGEEFIEKSLAEILALGLPTVLYQLPQITENEISPGSFSRLAARYSNFFLFKDTSGTDTVALSGVNREGVFFVRGGEGDYRKWHKSCPGGLYDGFLLGSANCFAPQYDAMLKASLGGKKAEAEEISAKVTRLVLTAMGKAQDFPFGNAFANANKAFDHFLALGPKARDLPPPMTHSGNLLPKEYIAFAGDLLEKEGLMPEKGYV